MEISSTQIIKIIQQYLKKNHLLDSLNALERETGIRFNDELPKDILAGNWKQVLVGLLNVDLSAKLLIPLYEEMILELVQDGQLDTATVLLGSEPMILLKDLNPTRYNIIKKLLNEFDVKLAFGNKSPVEIRRQLAKEFSGLSTPNSDDRLIEIIHQSLKYQYLNGKLTKNSDYNLYLDKILVEHEKKIKPVNNLYKAVKFKRKEHPEAVQFSPDGEYFCIGTFDGFLEVWDYKQCKLRKDLQFQRKVIYFN